MPNLRHIEERIDFLIFDFEKFTDIASSVYPETAYSFNESMGVFRYYFEKYEELMGNPHPPIKADQIARICKMMPKILAVGSGSDYADIDASAYPALIDKHFNTRYRNCDYRINHFFSGKIRENRFFEELY